MNKTYKAGDEPARTEDGDVIIATELDYEYDGEGWE